jgi:hypothetical protein
VQRRNDAPERQHMHFEAARVTERDDIDAGAVGQYAERPAFDHSGSLCALFNTISVRDSRIARCFQG